MGTVLGARDTNKYFLFINSTVAKLSLSKQRK